MDVQFRDGRTITIDDIETSEPARSASFVISIRKSGSTMITYMSKLIAEALGIGFLDVGSWLFYNNIPAQVLYADPALLNIIRPGIVYAGFRDYPLVLRNSPQFRNAQKLVFIRDPRDALVSEYFSNAFSHNIPRNNGCSNIASSPSNMMTTLRNAALQTDVENYVLQRADAFTVTAKKFFTELQEKHTLVLKYEDWIFDKYGLAKQLCAHLNLAATDEQLRRVASMTDIRPAAENPRSFVRKVTPGDYREKLTPETISELNSRLKEVLVAFGYSP
jgi:hypothetical protein